MTIFTLGHSTWSLEEFAGILQAYEIAVLVDVRSYPGSRRVPHFSRDQLACAMDGLDIEYVWLGDRLGGLRKSGLGERSPNWGWRVEGFRNYADYMGGADFRAGIDRLLDAASRGNVVMMCAERLYWRCHRRLIADDLVAHGHTVVHIFDAAHSEPHELTGFARVVDGVVTYPAGDALQAEPGIDRRAAGRPANHTS